MIEHWLDWLSKYSEYVFLFPNASIPYNSVLSYFQVYYFYFQQELKFWLIHLAIWLAFWECLIHVYFTDVPHFDSFSQIPFCAVSFLSFGWQHLHLWAHSCFLLFISTLQVGLICFYIFKSNVLVFCRQTFGFCIVNSECDAHLAVDNSLVYSYPKMFLLFFSLILTAWAWFKTIFLDSYLGFFLFVAPGLS